MDKTCAFAPATIANLNAGYDTFGMALSTIGDWVTLKKNNSQKHRIVAIDSVVDLPTDIQKNSCTAVIQSIQKAGYGQNVFVDVWLKKGFMAGSGLGSSAASSVAAGIAFNQLLDNPMSKDELLPHTAEGERVACGSPILDNVTAALYGGLVMLHNRQVIHLPIPDNLYILALFQQVEIKTADARACLPEKVDLNVATDQMANTALFIHALHEKNMTYLQQSLSDLLVEPYRKELIPNFDRLKSIAKKHESIGFGISGSGPTVFTLCTHYQQALAIQQEMLALVAKEDYETMSIIESLNENREGAKICENGLL